MVYKNDIADILERVWDVYLAALTEHPLNYLIFMRLKKQPIILIRSYSFIIANTYTNYSINTINVLFNIKFVIGRSINVKL